MKLIKRYANRKLYDTESSSYVTLDEIAKMVRNSDDIKIIDQKTSEDLTSVTLTQILYEEEKRSRRILPIPALKSIIQSGGDILHRISQPVQQFREETQRSMDRIFKVGEGDEEGRNPIREFTHAMQRAIEEMQTRVDERIKGAVDGLTHLPRVEDHLVDLSERLEALEEQVSNISRTVDRLWDARDHDSSRRFGRK